MLMVMPLLTLASFDQLRALDELFSQTQALEKQLDALENHSTPSAEVENTVETITLPEPQPAPVAEVEESQATDLAAVSDQPTTDSVDTVLGNLKIQLFEISRTIRNLFW